MIQLRTLGGLELTSSAGTSLEIVLKQPKRTALLCYLALGSRLGFCQRDTVLAMFWPDHDAEQARHALRQSLYFLRRSLGPGVLVSRGDDALGIAGGVCCDAVEFGRAIDGSRLEEALALYQGDLLPGFFLSDAPEFERWLEGERSRQREQAVDAARKLAEQCDREGKQAEAAQWARRSLEMSPSDEGAARRLIVMLDRAGNPTSALRAFDAFARTLEREYGLSPSDQTREIASRIRDRQANGALPSPALERATTPSIEVEPDLPPRARADSSSPAKFWQHFGPRHLVAGLLIALVGLGGARLLIGAHPAPATRPHQRLIVADFADLTRDSTLGDLVTQVVRSELARSRLASIAGQETVDNALRRMGRAPGEHLTNALAREVAVRQDINATLQGEVRAAGAGFVITASLIEASTGDAIYGASEIARDTAAILPAVERLADAIRGGIGESLTSIRATDSLYPFTTSSLAALRKDVEAHRAIQRGDFATGVTLLNDAIALDSNFATAQLNLWIAGSNGGMARRQGIRPLIRAYQLRDQLTESERYAVEGTYERDAVGDLPRAITAFRKHLAALKQDPVGGPGLYATLGDALLVSGDTAAARSVLEEARARYPTAINQALLARVLYALGDVSGAERVLDEASRRHPDHPIVLNASARLLAYAGHYEEAHALAGRGGASPISLQLQAEIDAMRGRLKEAITHLRSVEDAMRIAGDVESELEVAMAIAQLRLAAGDSTGLSDVDRALVRHPLDALDVLSRPYLSLARLYATAGKPRIGWTLLTAYEREFPPEYRTPDQWMIARTRAALYEAEGKTQQALTELLQASQTPTLNVGFYDDPGMLPTAEALRARLYDRLGTADSAIAVYERYLAVPSLGRSASDALELAPTLARLAKLYEQRGDSARAAAYDDRLALLRRRGDPGVTAQLTR
jgi:DNA-binding SARP family transcriptional activator/TolB-like protein